MDHAEHVNFLRNGIPATGGVWADFGAGRGAFTLALADLIAPPETSMPLTGTSARCRRMHAACARNSRTFASTTSWATTRSPSAAAARWRRNGEHPALSARPASGRTPLSALPAARRPVPDRGIQPQPGARRRAASGCLSPLAPPGPGRRVPTHRAARHAPEPVPARDVRRRQLVRPVQGVSTAWIPEIKPQRYGLAPQRSINVTSCHGMRCVGPKCPLG